MFSVCLKSFKQNITRRRKMNEEIKFKRGLGEGRWDRRLKQEMVRISKARTYEEAKHEWTATGEIWWDWNRDDTPSWVSESMNGRSKCLCGHKIVYHFEIYNEVTGFRECVGSDHINSYLILNEIKQRTGLTDEQITDAMIQEWIDVKIKSMKAEKWWEQFGEEFEQKFEAVREIDLRINVNEKGTYWDNTLSCYRPRTTIRKRASGGNMASIVWRWNHPDNRRNQQGVHGYPNKGLLNDLNEFYEMIEPLAKKMQDEDMAFKQRIILLNKQRGTLLRRGNTEIINDMLELYAIENFHEYSTGYTNDWETKFFNDIKVILSKENPLSPKQLETLQELLIPATEKQIQYLQALGFEGETNISKRQASNAINEIKQDGLNSHRT